MRDRERNSDARIMRYRVVDPSMSMDPWMFPARLNSPISMSDVRSSVRQEKAKKIRRVRFLIITGLVSGDNLRLNMHQRNQQKPNELYVHSYRTRALPLSEWHLRAYRATRTIESIAPASVFVDSFRPLHIAWPSNHFPAHPRLNIVTIL